MKHAPLIIAIAALTIAIFTPYLDIYKQYHTIGMQNTISPLLDTITDKACYPDGPNYQDKGETSALIYKREKHESCVNDTGNTLYARCYQAEWLGDSLFYTPTKDVRLSKQDKTHSCISEEEVNIPYYDEKLAKAKLGIKYLVVDHSRK